MKLPKYTTAILAATAASTEAFATNKPSFAEKVGQKTNLSQLLANKKSFETHENSNDKKHKINSTNGLDGRTISPAIGATLAISSAILGYALLTGETNLNILPQINNGRIEKQNKCNEQKGDICRYPSIINIYQQTLNGSAREIC